MAIKSERKNQRFKEKHLLDQENTIIKDEINSILKDQKPQDVRGLVDLVKSKISYPDEKIISVIKNMEYNQELILKEPYIAPTYPPKRLRDYFFARNYFAYEFWIIMVTISLSLTLVLVDVRVGFLFYTRYVVLCFLMLVISGWALTSIIFPQLEEKFTFLERVATSFGLSLFIVIIDGLFLNYTFRFSPKSIVISLVVITFVCLVISIVLRLKLGKDGFIFNKKKETKEVKVDEN